MRTFMSDPRYPVGPFQPQLTLTAAERRAMIEAIAAAPQKLREAVRELEESQLDTPYRDGGWTVRQVVHHIPESHMNAYVRLKLALTEEQPTIKPYDEAEWAKTGEIATTPITTSLALLDNLHERWVRLLRSLGDADFGRTFIHPDHGVVTIDWLLAMYAWHGRHHVGHITSLRERKGW